MGVLVHGDSIVDLTKTYDFKPMVTVDEFFSVNKYDESVKKLFLRSRRSKEGVVRTDLMRGMIICGHCGQKMTSGITVKPKQGKSYFFYRCDTPNCYISKKSGKSVKQNVRAKVILDFVYEYLEKHNFADKTSYELFLREIKANSENQTKILEGKLKSLQQQRRADQNNFEQIKAYLLDEQETDLKAIFKKDLNSKKKEIEDIDRQIKETKELLSKSLQAPISYQYYLELFGKLPETLRKTRTLQAKDEITKNIFLNFTLKDWNIASYQLKSPFKELVERSNFISGRDAQNRTGATRTPCAYSTTKPHPDSIKSCVASYATGTLDVPPILPLNHTPLY